MRVALVRNLHEERNISMKLMGDRLEQSLARRADVVNVRPWWPTTMNSRSAFGKLTGYVSRFAMYPSAVAKVNADVYHIVDHAYAHVAPKLPRERTICHCHDLMLLKAEHGEFGNQPVPKLATALLRHAVQHLKDAGTVITISNATKQDVISMLHVDPTRIRVLYPPLDPLYRPRPANVDRSALRRELGFDSRPVLLHLGGNWFYKNVEGLLRAFAIVLAQSRGDKPLLVKAGKGLSRDQRRLAASLGVLDHVIERESLSNEDIQKYYWACDALVFPSLWEGFGWPPVEAMASGLPAICGRAGALVEAAGDAAEMVDPNSPEDIARGILRVMNESSYRDELVSRGFVNACRFDARGFADSIYDLYCNVAGIKRSKPVCAG